MAVWLVCVRCVRVCVAVRCAARAVALVVHQALPPLVAVVRGSGKPEAKLMAVHILKDMTADVACQLPLVEKGAVRACRLGA